MPGRAARQPVAVGGDDGRRDGRGAHARAPRGVRGRYAIRDGHSRRRRAVLQQQSAQQCAAAHVDGASALLRLLQAGAAAEGPAGRGSAGAATAAAQTPRRRDRATRVRGAALRAARVDPGRRHCTPGAA
eukprot:2137376-Prymnesium_polylepis.2